MKILLVSRRFYPEITGGGQISAFYIAKAIAKQGNEVSVLTFTEKENQFEEIKEVKIYREKIKSLKYAKKASNLDYMYSQISKKTLEYIKKLNPEVVHLLNFESIPKTSINIKKNFPNIKVVATVNGPNFGCFTGGTNYKGQPCLNCNLKNRFRDSIHKWGFFKGTLFYLYSFWYMHQLDKSYKKIDKFFLISKSLTPIMESRGVTKDRLEVIPNPIGDGFLDINKEINKKLSELHKKNKILLYVGRISKDKGINYTINSLKYLPNNYILLVVGWGDYLLELKKLVKELELENRVIFFNGKEENNHEIMKTYYINSDLLCHFPDFYEPFGRVIIESMSLGKPVLAYPIGGISEIIENNSNSILLDSKEPKQISESIKKVLQDKKLYEKLSEQSIKTVKEKYSDEVIAKKYLRGYNN